VGVQGGNGDPRRGQAQTAEDLCHHRERLADARAGDLVDRLAQRQVARQEEDPQSTDHEHREGLRAARERRQHLGVPGVRIAGRPERLLVQRRGRDRVHLAGLRQANRPLDRLASGAPRRSLDHAHLERRRVDVAQVEDVRGAVRVAAGGRRRRGRDRHRKRQGVGSARERPEVPDDQRPRATVHVGIRQRLDRDLRADPGGISHRHRDQGPLVV